MTQSLASRLWIYQKERFPLIKTLPLLAVFSAASINVSAMMAGRDLPGWGTYAAGLALALILFFQMRVCDENKDLEDDTRYRPERPIPRGLVSLRLITGLGLLTVPLAVLVAWSTSVLWLLAIVWIWLAAMTFEFGAPTWLKARPVLYLLSHMAIMPLIDLLLTGLEWTGTGPAPDLWLFLALSFVNGCVLELGRKIWAPTAEREGVETYSGLWGPRRATQIWVGLLLLAFGLLLGVGLSLGTVWPMAIAGGLGLAACLMVAGRYLRNPDEKAQAQVDMMAGFWVLICYGSAGFLSLLAGGP